MADARRHRGVLLLGIAAALLTLGFDRWVKEMLIARLNGQVPVAVTDFFNLVMVWNRGVSFGLFQQGDATGRYLLMGFSLAVALALGLWLWRLGLWLWRAPSRWLGFGLGLIIGGALGNAYDRFFYGAVADFFDFHVMDVHFWAFNIADAGISVGVAILLFDSVFNDLGKRR